MPIKVMIPTALRMYAQGQDTVELQGGSVLEVMRMMGDRFPELRKHLFNDKGQVRNFVNVFVNEDNIRDRENLDTPLKEGDEVAIVPAVAGG